MKIPTFKSVDGLKIARLVFFALLSLFFSAPGSYAIDPTNRLDFDGDGIADIAVYREGGNDRTSQTYTPSNWYFYNIQTFAFGGIQWGRTLDVPIPADFAGDGKTDPAIFRWFDPSEPPYDFNQIWILNAPIRGFGNAGGRKMGRNFVAEVSPSPQKAEIGEFQRINLATPATPSYKYTFFYQLPSGGLVSKDTNYPAGLTGTYHQVPVPDDYTGDGVSEIAVFDTTSRCYHVWLSPAPESASEPQVCFDAGYSTPAPGDYDGDGKVDYASVKITGADVDWKIKSSKSGADLTATIHLNSTNIPIKPVVADYDGDGKSDVAVAQSVGGAWQWTIQKSGCTSCSYPFATTFGFDTDIPLASPYFYDRWY